MPLRITQQERACLQQLARSATDARLLRRAQALLDLDAGDSPRVVSKRYQVARSTIYNWIKRCRSRGLNREALLDLPRPGRPSGAGKRPAPTNVPSPPVTPEGDVNCPCEAGTEINEQS